MANRKEPRRVINLLLLIIAFGAIALLMSVTFLAFGPGKDTARLVIPSVVASLVAFLVVYIFTRGPLSSVGHFITREQLRNLAELLASELKEDAPEKRSTVLYDSWYEVPWERLLHDARSLVFCVSYMDTWITHASLPFRGIFERGGQIRAILPKPETVSAQRVIERFPEYAKRPELLQQKIAGTADKFAALLDASKNRSAKLEVYRTDRFIMGCIVIIDESYVVISPFDHFRRGHIEAPAVVVRVNERHRAVHEWAKKELDEFIKIADHEPYSLKSSKRGK